MKQKKEKTPEEMYKLLRQSFVLYVLTAIVTPFVAIFLHLTEKTNQGPVNLIILVILTEVYCIMRAIFDYHTKKEMEQKLFG